MRVAVARDLVAGAGDVSNERGLPRRHVAEHEERRARLRRRQELEQQIHVGAHGARQPIPVDAALRPPVVVEPILDVDGERVAGGLRRDGVEPPRAGSVSVRAHALPPRAAPAAPRARAPAPATTRPAHLHDASDDPR